MTNVFGFSTSSYNLTEVVTSQSALGMFMTFKFRSVESRLDVGCEFRNGKLVSCKLYPIEGDPVFIKPAASDALSTIKDTVARIQECSTKEYLPTIRSTLDTVSELENSKITVNDFTQEIVINENSVSVTWEPFVNCLSNQQNKLILEFEKGSSCFSLII